MNQPVLRTDLPYRLPDFGSATPDHFRAALEQGMSQQRQALADLRDNDSPATVENVLGAWEDAQATLRRACLTLATVRLSDSSDELDALHEEFAPVLADHEDRIHLDQRLYARLQQLDQRVSRGEAEADAQDRFALAELLKEFRRAGVCLDDEDRERLRWLNQRIARLEARFTSLNRSARNAGGLQMEEAELTGLSPEEREALRTESGYRIELVNTTRQPAAAKLTNPEARTRLFQASITRALTGHDTTGEVIIAIARARAERAQLLGYPHHAALVTEAGCAGSVEAVLAMLVPLAQAALAKAREEAAELRRCYTKLEPDRQFTAADWDFVSSVLHRERFDFDESELAGHLTIDCALDAVRSAAEDLYGITLTPVEDIVGHAPDVQAFEVWKADGTAAGLFLMDLWARPSKQGGAWMSSIVEQSHRDGALPVVTNNCNFSPDTRTISWDQVITVFHEFGHALHGLLSEARYASRSGTNTPRDFVEFPSQVNEHWAWTPGRVLPPEWINRLEAAERFGQGYATAETELAAVLDLAWHTTPLEKLPIRAEEVEAFERAALERYSLYDPLVTPRYRSQYFAHIWSDSYAASYYGYAWAKVMAADTVEWFQEQTETDPPALTVREAGEHLRHTLLGPGGSVDAMETYRRFRGRNPQLGALARRLGFAL